MGFSHGSKAKFWFGSVGAPSTNVDYSAYFHEVNFPRIVDSAETSTFGNTFKTYVPGLKDSTFTATGRFDPVIDAILNGILQIEGIAFRYRPQGNTTGLVSYEGSFFVTSYNPSSSIGDMSGFAAAFQITTDVTRAII